MRRLAVEDEVLRVVVEEEEVARLIDSRSSSRPCGARSRCPAAAAAGRALSPPASSRRQQGRGVVLPRTQFRTRGIRLSRAALIPRGKWPCVSARAQRKKSRTNRSVTRPCCSLPIRARRGLAPRAG